MMEEKDTLIHMHATNRKRLFEELNQFVVRFSFLKIDYFSLRFLMTFFRVCWNFRWTIKKF